jgi:hypothetical protein
MKSTLATLLFLLPILTGAACDQNSPSPADGNENAVTENTESMSDRIIMKIGSKAFTVTLLDNPTATAL